MSSGNTKIYAAEAEACALLRDLSDTLLVEIANLAGPLEVKRLELSGAGGYLVGDLADVYTRGADLPRMALGLLCGRGHRVKRDGARWSLGGSPAEVEELVEAAQRALVVMQDAGLARSDAAGAAWQALSDALGPWPWPHWAGNRPA